MTRPNSNVAGVIVTGNSEEAVSQMAQSIVDVFEVGYETRQADSNIAIALELLRNAGRGPTHTSITDCTFHTAEPESSWDQ